MEPDVAGPFRLKLTLDSRADTSASVAAVGAVVTLVVGDDCWLDIDSPVAVCKARDSGLDETPVVDCERGGRVDSRSAVPIDRGVPVDGDALTR